MRKDFHLLIKFGEYEHIHSLQREGLVFCNTLKYFTQLEDGKFRGDPLESAVKLQYIANPLFQFRKAKEPESPWLKLNAKDALITTSDANPKGNIFCMSAFKVPVSKIPTTYIIDERCQKFGSHYLLIYNIPDFLKRTEDRLNELNIAFYHAKVEYLDLKKYTGDKNPFQKSAEYSFQEEFRLYLQSDGQNPYTFSIGSIEDISIIYDFQNTKSFQVKLENKHLSE